MPNTSPNEIALATIKMRNWTRPEIVGQIFSRRILKARTITTGGTVHHLESCTFLTRKAGMERPGIKAYSLFP